MQYIGSLGGGSERRVHTDIFAFLRADVAIGLQSLNEVFDEGLSRSPSLRLGLGLGCAGTGHPQSQSLQGLPRIGGPIGHFQPLHNAIDLMGVLQQLGQS